MRVIINNVKWWKIYNIASKIILVDQTRNTKICTKRQFTPPSFCFSVSCVYSQSPSSTKLTSETNLHLQAFGFTLTKKWNRIDKLEPPSQRSFSKFNHIMKLVPITHLLYINHEVSEGRQSSSSYTSFCFDVQVLKPNLYGGKINSNSDIIRRSQPSEHFDQRHLH